MTSLRISGVTPLCPYMPFSVSWPVAYPGILFGGGSTNSGEDRRQREWGTGGGRPLARGS